jgi:hypothetical protein
MKKYVQWLRGNLQGGGAQKGQSIIIITFAFLGLLAMLGLALDLGLVYIEQVRVSRTTDAAALSSVVELPFEEEAVRRAVEFIELNGYSPETTEIYVRGCIDTSKFTNLTDRNDGFYNVSVIDAANDAPEGVYPPGDPVPPATFSGGNVSGFRYQPASTGEVRARFLIDTLSYQPVDVDDDTGTIETNNEENCQTGVLYGTANKLRVVGQVLVNMNFMQFFGFDDVPVEDAAVGENVTNLDVAVVFDVSGSMDFETTCFDCWEPYPSTDPNYDVIENPWPTNGTFNPLPDITANPVCSQTPTASTVNVGGTNYQYLVHEAELYSRDVPLHGWKLDRHLPGYGFWVLQRANRGADEVGADARGAYLRTHPYPVYSQGSITDPTTGYDNYPQLQGAAYDAECFSGPNLSGACWQTEANSLGESTPPSDVPWVEYDFTPPWSGTTHIWMRAQAGDDNDGLAWTGQSATAMNEYNRAIFWQVLQTTQGGEVLISLVNTNGNHIDGGIYTSLNESDDPRRPKSDRWRWVKLGSVATTQSVTHTLRLYQGSAGFNLDKLIFTSYSGGSANTNGSSLNNAFETSLLDLNSGRGPEATPGSATREACNICNPVFGQEVQPAQCGCMMGSGDTAVANATDYPAGGSGFGCTAVVTTTDHLIESDLFHDIDPLRSAKEALKKFAIRLDPKFDQIGFVPFSASVYNIVDEVDSNSTGDDEDGTVIRSELQCLRWAAKNHPDKQRACYDAATVANPISYTTVIRVVERVENWNFTNIGQGMREGLEELGIEVVNNPGITSECATAVNDKKVCDRSGAARRVLILMTDGSPNRSSGCPSSAQIPADDKWTDNLGEGNPAYDCAIYYAKQAANNNIVVYAIGIGAGANVDLMTAMAEGTDPTSGKKYFESRGGKFYNAVSPADLDGIFEQILSNIFVRIIG